MLLNSEWVNNEIKKEIKKYLETNGSKHKTTPNLGDTAKGVLKGKFIAMHEYIKKTGKSQINNFTLHLKLEQQQQTKPRLSRRNKILKIRAELNYLETKIKFKGSMNSGAGSFKI